LLTMKPLANRGISDSETIPASSIPRLVSLSAPAVLALAPCLDPSNLCLAITSATRRFPLFSSPPPSSTFHLSRYPLRRTAPPLSPSPKRSQHQAHLLSTEGVCLRTSNVLVSPLFSLNGLSTILFLTLFPPRLPAVVALRFPFVASHSPFLSCRLVLCSLPRVLTITFVPSSSLCLSSCLLIPPLVLRFSCRITF